MTEYEQVLAMVFRRFFRGELNIEEAIEEVKQIKAQHDEE